MIRCQLQDPVAADPLWTVVYEAAAGTRPTDATDSARHFAYANKPEVPPYPNAMRVRRIVRETLERCGPYTYGARNEKLACEPWKGAGIRVVQRFIIAE